MSALPKLSGFKILGGVVRLTLLQPGKEDTFPSQCTYLLCKERLNLTFLTCARDNSGWALDMVLDSGDARCVLDLLAVHFSQTRCTSGNGAVLSLFPHKHNPAVTGALLDLLGRHHVLPQAVAHSTSAISLILPEEALNAVTQELFTTFRFSAFRTPEDWKLTQKGKETLYKEVVASYQEQRPRVYGLDWQDRQELLWVRLRDSTLRPLAGLFWYLSHRELPLIFLTSTPSLDRESRNLFFCLPESHESLYKASLARLPRGAIVLRTPGVAHFSMNGPHFGDRYGIATQVLAALSDGGVQLLALSCSIASIAGAVPARQMNTAIECMRHYFDIPSVIKKN